jgi:hypothetical protein
VPDEVSQLLEKTEDRLAGAIRRYVTIIETRARAVIAIEVVATVLLGLFALTHLGVNMDNKTLLSPDLPFQKAAQAFRRYFPNLDDSLLIVVDAETPEQARDAARDLAASLAALPQTFSDVYVPGGEPFFQRYGLLYRTPEELDEFVDQIALIQPLIAELSGDPSIARLAQLIRFALEQEKKNPGTMSERWPAVLDQIGSATVQVFQEYPVSVSWESLIVEGSALDPQSRQVIVAEPVLDFGHLLAARDAIAAIRSAARDLDLSEERGVRVRITGNPALNYDEMLGLAWDIGVSSLLSFLLVTAVLYVALLNMRLVSAAATTLLVGLIWTAAFAAATVGHLNVVSIAFGVLFIGLGVDFAIHLGMHYADAFHRGEESRAAMNHSLEQVGSALVLCAFTTAIGFFAFAPTGYRGVAELGLIAGGGMFIILFQTFTLFPAMVVRLLEGRPQPGRGPLPFRLSPPKLVATHPATIVAVALLLGGIAATRIPTVGFDMNVISIRDPRTESVKAFKDLLARSRTSPWYIDSLTASLDDAEQLAGQLRKLEVVRSSLSLADYVPTDQEEKREILATVAMLLEVPSAPVRKPAPTIDEQVAALRELRDALAVEWLQRDKSALGRSAKQLRRHLDRFLERVEREGNAEQALADLQELLLGNFSGLLDRLRRAVDPPPLTLADLPPTLTRRMLAPDGHARVQTFPRDNLADTAEVTEFVDAVREVDPSATGVAVNLLEFGRAILESLRQALAWAFSAIILLLLFLWRRVGDTLLALVPLVLGAVLTVGFMSLIGMHLNFVNVVVLPLLIGIGVDSGIHLVHTSRSATSSDTILDSVTARAVFFSAVTTITSFGSLSLSSHRGIASMGILLVCGMLIILCCNLVVLPALLAIRNKRKA